MGLGLSVSAVIPVWNGARYLPAAIASIRAQTRPPAEIVVVDDGSTDGSADVARSLGSDIVCIAQSNAGPAAARTRGVAESSGDLVAFLDADDVWPAKRCERLLAELERDPGLDVVFGRVVKSSSDTLSQQSTPLPGIVFGSGLFRRSVFERIPLEAALRFAEDVDWFVHAAELGLSARMIGDVTLFYRQHGESLTADRDATSRGLLTVLRRSLMRRRAMTGGEVPAIEPFAGMNEDDDEVAAPPPADRARLARRS